MVITGMVMACTLTGASCFVLIMSIFLMTNWVPQDCSLRDWSQVSMCQPVRGSAPSRKAEWELKLPVSWPYISQVTSNPSSPSGFRNPSHLLSTFPPLLSTSVELPNLCELGSSVMVVVVVARVVVGGWVSGWFICLFVLNKGLLISQEARKIQPTRTQSFNCFLKGGWREKYFYFFQ